MLGRVGSTNASIVFLGQILGLAVSGVLAEAIGVRLVFFLCGVLAFVLVGAGRMFTTPARSGAAVQAAAVLAQR